MNVDLREYGEALLASKRSAEFLKHAAKAGLSINAIYNALAVEGVDLLLCEEGKKDEKFQEAARAASQRVASMQNLGFSTDQAENDKLVARYISELKELGWCQDQDSFGNMANDALLWLQRNAVDAERIIHGNIENPARRKKFNDALETMGNPVDLMATLIGMYIPDQVSHGSTKALSQAQRVMQPIYPSSPGSWASLTWPDSKSPRR